MPNTRQTARTQMLKVNDTLYSWSWGKAHINWTVIGPLMTTKEYTKSHCSQKMGDLPGDRKIDRWMDTWMDRYRWIRC